MSASRLISLTAAVVALSVIFASCSKDSSGPGNEPDPIVPQPPPAPAVLIAAANITACSPGDMDDQTAALIVKDSTATVLAVGDMTMSGTLADFQNCYGPTWGQFKSRTYPVIGNHEYGAAYDRTTLDSVFQYFGDRIPASGKPNGYYSFNLGAWHVVVLNDNWDKIGGRFDTPDAAQLAWLQADLAAATNKCVLATFHQGRFLSSTTAGWTERTSRRSTWAALEAAGVDVVINGHEHMYERMKPMLNDGTVDDARGIRQFNVGTGGESLYWNSEIVAHHPNSEIRIHDYGILRMSLDSTSYSWTFLLEDGSPAVDSGSGTCH